MALSSAQVQLLQELFILATGRPANTPNMAMLESLVGPNNDFSKIDALINTHVSAQVQALNEITIIQTIARNGLGLSLQGDQAIKASNDLKAAGLDTWAKVFNWLTTNTSSYGVTLDNRAEASTHFTNLMKEGGKADLFTGLNITATVGTLLQSINSSATSLDTAKTSLGELASDIDARGMKVAVVDGYVSGAKVTADADGNGKLDWTDKDNDGQWDAGEGEWFGETDSSGDYIMPTDAPRGTITASGGIDIMTKKAFQGVLTAPAGSTVVNPLTTMVQALVQSGSTLEDANKLLQRALDLPEGVDPMTYDPLKHIDSTDPVAKADALSVQITALQIANIVTQLGAARNTNDPTAGSAAAVGALATTIKQLDSVNSTTKVNLAGSDVISGVLVGIGLGGSSRDVTLTHFTIASNEKAAAATDIQQLAKVAVVTQGEGVDAIIRSQSSGGDLVAEAQKFVADLNANIAKAEPGEIRSGTPTPTPSGPTPTPATPTPTPASPTPATPTPTPDSTPTPTPTPATFTVTDTTNTITFGGDATGDIDVSITGAVATFVRGGVTAASTVASITTKTIQLAASETLAVNGADITGLGAAAIKGAGTLKTTEGLTVSQLAGITFTSFTGTKSVHSVADTGTNLKNDTTWVIGSTPATVTDANVSLVDLKTIQAATTGLVNATAVTTTSGTAADALLLLVTNENTSGDKIDMKADVAVTITDTPVSLATLKSIEAATAGLVNATAVTTTSGTAADALLLLNANEGTSGDKIDMKDDVAVTITDTPVTLADLKTIESKTTGLVNATAVTTTSGTLADAVLMLFTNEATSGNKIDMKSDVAVTISDTGSVAAADLVSINGKTTALVGITGATAVTGSAGDIKGVVDALGTAGDKLNVGTVTGAVTNATLTVTSGTSDATEAAAILAGSSGAVTVRLDNSHVTTGPDLLVAAGDVINIDPGNGTFDLTASAQAAVGDVNVNGEWFFDSTSKLFTWWDGAQNSIKLMGAGATVTVGADTVSIGVPTFAVTNSSGTYTVGAANGAVALTVVDSDFVFTPTAGDPVTIPFAGVNSLVVNSITLTATPIATTNLSVSGTGGVNVSVGALQPTGTYALTTANDIITATNGANIAALNTGAVTTAETLDISAVAAIGITMTVVQASGFTTINANAADDIITLSDTGTVTAKTFAGKYQTAGAGNTITALAATNVSGAGGADIINVAALTATGTYTNLAAADTIQATTANIAAVNGGAATGAGILDISSVAANNVTMTVVQHNALASITANATDDTITLSDTGTVAAITFAGKYQTAAAGNTITALAATNVSGAAGADIINVAALTATGTYTNLTAADTIQATSANIAAVNGGAATGAGILDISSVAANNVTMTAAQASGFTTINANSTDDTITLSGTGTVTAKAFAGKYQTAAGGNTITALAATNVSGAGGADIINVAALTATGTYTNLAAADTIQATTANIAAVNGGAATGAGILDISSVAANNVTMTVVQHNALTSITANATDDTITLSDTGTVAAVTFAGKYQTAGAGNTITALAATNVSGAAGADIINVAALTATGTYTNLAAADTIQATSANIAAVNGGGATGAGILDISSVAANNVTMTAAQASGFTTINANSTDDTITLSGTGTVTAKAFAGKYQTAAGGNTITALAATNVSGAGGADIINVAALTATGTYTNLAAADTIQATTANIAAVNGGAATGAGILDISSVAANNVTMTVVQHNALASITANATDDTITLSDTGTVAAITFAGKYQTAGAGNTITALAATNVSGAAGADIINVAALTATGTYTNLTAADTIQATSANIAAVNGGGATGAGILDISSVAANNVTMTAAQASGFTTINANSTDDTITLSGTGTVTAKAFAGKYQTAAGGNTITALAATNVSGAGGADIINVAALTATGTYTNLAAADTIQATTANIAAVNGGGATGAGILDISSVAANNVTMTAAQASGFTTINANGSDDTITLSDAGTATAKTFAGKYQTAGAGNTITALAATNVSGAGGADIINVAALTATGTYTNLAAADTIQATTANIAAVNGGAATGAGILDISSVAANNVTMTVVQHNALASITANATDDTITLSDTGTVAAITFAGKYQTAAGGNTITALAATNVSGAAGADIINVAALTATGTYTNLTAADTIQATSANIAAVNGGGATGAGILDISSVAANNVTMTAAQASGFTTINANSTDDTITLSGTGTVTAKAFAGKYQTAAGGNTITALAATNVSGAGGADIINVAALTATGTYTNLAAADTIQATTANIAAVNGGAATGAGILDISSVAANNVTMTVVQHNALASITANATDDTITLSDTGTVAAITFAGKYQTAAAGNTITALAATNVSGAAGADIINVAALTATGTYTNLTAADTIQATSANIAAVNGGGATGAGILDISSVAANNVTMTAAQASGFTTINANSTDDTITLSGTGTVTAKAFAGKYQTAAGGNTITALAATNVSGAGGADIINVAALTATGTYTNLAAADTIQATTANIAAVNGGAATGAGILDISSVAANNVTMTVVQHNALTSITANATDDTITLSDTGTVAAVTFAGKYQTAGAGNTITALAATNVSGAGGADIINVAALTATGTYTNLAAADTIQATTANIAAVNGGAATGAGILDISSVAANNVTMTVVQHNALASITANATDDTITLSDTGTVAAITFAGKYQTAAAGNTITALAATNVSGAAGADIINVAALTATGTYTNLTAADTITMASGASISGVNSGAATGAGIADITGSVTMTAAQRAGFTTFTAGGSTDQITLSDATTSFTAANTIETYVLGGSSTNAITMSSAVAQSVTANAAATDTITLSQTTAVLSTVTTFASGVDKIVLGGGVSAAVAVVAAGVAANASAQGIFFDTSGAIAINTAGSIDGSGNTGGVIIHYAVESDTGKIYYDADGNFKADAVQIGIIGATAIEDFLIA